MNSFATVAGKTGHERIRGGQHRTVGLALEQARSGVDSMCVDQSTKALALLAPQACRSNPDRAAWARPLPQCRPLPCLPRLASPRASGFTSPTDFLSRGSPKRRGWRMSPRPWRENYSGAHSDPLRRSPPGRCLTAPRRGQPLVQPLLQRRPGGGGVKTLCGQPAVHARSRCLRLKLPDDARNRAGRGRRGSPAGAAGHRAVDSARRRGVLP